MSIYLSGTEARLGSLGIPPLIPCPPLPNIIAEWAAILPLVCHLASQRDDFNTTGEIALLGSLSVGIFPPLGSLSGLARLVGRGTKFLDYASTKGGLSRTVWDVRWGSAFPCANGAASVAITKQLMGRFEGRIHKMPVSVPQQPLELKEMPENSSYKGESVATVSKTTSNRDETSELSSAALSNMRVRRCQILHVYQFYRKQQRQPLKHTFNQLRLSKSYQLVCAMVLIAVAAFLCAFGVYGTAAIIICAAVSKLIARSIIIRRPSGYLANNETHDACMLVASHENAIEWHLYIGDRGIVDTILNKPMFVVPEGKSLHLISYWFWLSNFLQLAAMTFVAAQKAWDGVCLVVLMALHWGLHMSLHGRSLATYWLENEGVDARVKSFEFSGRFAMIGAIQVFSRTTTSRWMDDILVPHPRRDAWLGLLNGHKPQEKFVSHDLRWIELAASVALASAEMLKRELEPPPHDV